MATQAQAIIDAAIASSTANDGGASPIANDSEEMIAALDRKVKQIYSLVALPASKGGSASGDFFKTTWTVTVGTPNTSLVALPSSPDIALIDAIVTAASVPVAIVPYRDFLDGLAEFAPAVVILDRKLRSCARTGDPAAGAVLTILGSYHPATLVNLTDYIGATTPADAATTTWPSQVGDPFLVAYLGLYLAMKDGTRSDAEVANYQNEMQSSAETLAVTLGINAAALVVTQEH